MTSFIKTKDIFSYSKTSSFVCFVLLASLNRRLSRLKFIFILFNYLIIAVLLFRTGQEHVQLLLLLVVKFHDLKIAVHNVGNLSTLISFRFECSLSGLIIGH